MTSLKQQFLSLSKLAHRRSRGWFQAPGPCVHVGKSTLSSERIFPSFAVLQCEPMHELSMAEVRGEVQPEFSARHCKCAFPFPERGARALHLRYRKEMVRRV